MHILTPSWNNGV